MLSRRRVLLALGLSTPGLAPRAIMPVRAQGFGQLFALKTDAGDIVPNFRVPASLDPALLRGVIAVGAGVPDVTIYEFFDYRCPYCRAASGEIDRLVSDDAGVRLALVNNAILSPGSLEAARVQQAVLKLRGDDAAYSLHKAIFAAPGAADGRQALALAAQLGIVADEAARDALAREATGPQVAAVVARQMQLAADLGLATTPSFVVDGTGLTGWPGPRSLRAMVAAVRKCDRLACAPGLK